MWTLKQSQCHDFVQLGQEVKRDATPPLRSPPRLLPKLHKNMALSEYDLLGYFKEGQSGSEEQNDMAREEAGSFRCSSPPPLSSCRFVENSTAKKFISPTLCAVLLESAGGALDPSCASKLWRTWFSTLLFEVEAEREPNPHRALQ